MSMPLAGPCGPWTPVWSCSLSAAATAVTGTAVQAATEVLDALTGHRFGLCTSTLRPCRRDCLEDVWTAYVPMWTTRDWLLPDPRWVDVVCGACPGTCSCTMISDVVLPGPVFDVLSVKVDGVALGAGAYRLDDATLLTRIDGQRWPLCNDLSKDDTHVGTWSVTARYGEEVPIMGQIAVGELATQLAKSLACDEDCTLPAAVQQLTRQGVSMTFLDPTQLFGNGNIGLYHCDLFVATYNPDRLRNRARVFDLDTPPARRTS